MLNENTFEEQLKTCALMLAGEGSAYIPSIRFPCEAIYYAELFSYKAGQNMLGHSLI